MPSEPASMVAYAAAFEAEFAFHLRERPIVSLGHLDVLFHDAEDQESNMRA